MSHRFRYALIFAVPLLCSGTVTAAPMHDFADHVKPCAICHGDRGQIAPKAYYPYLAGKPAGYLYAQLQNFRDEQRHNAVMQSLIAYLSDDYLREMAAYYAAQPLPALPALPPTVDPATLEMGRELVHHGDAARKVPACTQCHGDELQGAAPAIPGLLGMSQEYLGEQLSAWRAGLRQAAAPDCMATIARHLDRAQVGAIAAWIASQQGSSQHRPAARPPAKMPLKCGSVP